MFAEINNGMEYRLLLEKASDLLIVLQHNKVKYVNQKPLVDFGYEISEIVEKNIYDFIHVDDRERVLEFQVKKAKNEGMPDDLIFRIINKNGHLVFVKLISITSVWEEKPASFICIKNITDKKLHDLIIKKSEYLLLAIIDNLPDPTLVIDVNSKVYLWNKALENLSGVTSKDMIGKDGYERAIPYFGYKKPMLLDLMLKSDTENQKEYDFFQRTDDILIAGRFLSSKDGKNFHVWVTSSILFDIKGNIIGVIESFRDMTDIRDSENKIKTLVRDKEILLKEIHHRVKNNLQLIQSMLNIQLQYVKDPEAADVFKDSLSRIETMTMIHNELYKHTIYADIDFGIIIPKIIDNLRSMYKKQEINIKIEVEEIHLGIDDAIPCGLILNELVSNCLKHAYPIGKKGLILIKLFIDSNTQRCHLSVQDDGLGLPTGFEFSEKTNSFGLLMVKLLSKQLGGTIKLNSLNGTEISMVFPLKIPSEGLF